MAHWSAGLQRPQDGIYRRLEAVGAKTELGNWLTDRVRQIVLVAGHRLQGGPGQFGFHDQLAAEFTRIIPWNR